MYTLHYKGDAYNANRQQILEVTVALHKKGEFDWVVEKSGECQVWCDDQGSVGFTPHGDICPGAFCTLYLNLN